MKREVVVFLVLGSFVISLLEAPSAFTSVARAWNGPYPELGTCSGSEKGAEKECHSLVPDAPLPMSPTSSLASLPAPHSPQPKLIPAAHRTSNSSDPTSLPSLAEN